jgi:hypothetical protein
MQIIIAVIITILLIFHLAGCVTINKPIYIFVENSPVSIGVDNDLSGIKKDR